jgi:hypothetical protein
VRKALLVLALLLTGCAEAQQSQEVNVAASPRPGVDDATAAKAKAWLDAHPDVVPEKDRDVYQPAVVLATSKDDDSWQARLWTHGGIRSVKADGYCTDPSVAYIEIVPGDVVRWYDRPDGTVDVGALEDDYLCDNLAIMRVLVPGALSEPPR